MAAPRLPAFRPERSGGRSVSGTGRRKETTTGTGAYSSSRSSGGDDYLPRLAVHRPGLDAGGVADWRWLVALALGIAVGALRTTPFAPGAARAMPGSSCSATFRCWCRCSSGSSSCRSLPPTVLWVKQDVPAKEFVTAALCLGLFTSARVAEQVRAGIGSLPRGQRDAGAGAGPDPGQAYRHVILPQACASSFRR
jgi:hypothetical protein